MDGNTTGWQGVIRSSGIFVHQGVDAYTCRRHVYCNAVAAQVCDGAYGSSNGHWTRVFNACASMSLDRWLTGRAAVTAAAREKELKP